MKREKKLNTELQYAQYKNGNRSTKQKLSDENESTEKKTNETKELCGQNVRQ